MCRIAGLIALFLSLSFAAAAKGSLRELRFSPDGRYVIAQDDKTITVLTLKPFSVLFRIPAEKATIADFTPDSRQVLFVSSLSASPARVERWSVADGVRGGSTEISLPDCGTVGLSPDGSFLACAGVDGLFRLFEVSSGTTLVQKKYFGETVLTDHDYRDCRHCPTVDVPVDGRVGSALIGLLMRQVSDTIGVG